MIDEFKGTINHMMNFGMSESRAEEHIYDVISTFQDLNRRDPMRLCQIIHELKGRFGDADNKDERYGSV